MKMFEKCTLGRAFSFEKLFLSKKKLILKIENDRKDFTKKWRWSYFGEYDGTDGKLGEVKTKTFNWECIIQNFILFARRAPTHMKYAHTGLFYSEIMCHEFCGTTSARARQGICIPSVSVRHTQLMTKLKNVHFFEKRVHLGARSYSTSFLHHKTKFARAHSPKRRQ